MSILSLEFLALAAAVWAVYYLLPLRYRWLALTAGSGVFLIRSGWQSVAHLSAAALVTWLGGRLLEALENRAKNQEGWGKAQKWKTRKKALLAFLLVLDFGAMAFVKYQPALSSWLKDLTRGNITFPIWELAAPLGLSYFTFQSAGWLIDIYRGKAKAWKNPLKVWLFVGYFPQLTQGPISSFKELGSQLITGHVLDPEGVVSGFSLMLWGYFKKLVIADRLGITTAALLKDYRLMPGWMVLGGVILYGIRLYGDFSGGMDVVRGLSGMFGIELPENFRRPFFSKSVAEYWRRWHITLGAWFRSYLLYPLTTSPLGLALGKKSAKIFGKKTGRLIPTALATFLIFLLIGIWHTANWNAVIYGGYFGLVMSGSILLEPIWKKLDHKLELRKKRWVQYIRILRTWMLILPAQFFAFTNSPAQGIALMAGCFTPWQFSGAWDRITQIMGASEWGLVAVGLALLLAVDLFDEWKGNFWKRLARTRFWIRWAVLLFLLLTVSVFGIYGQGLEQNAFLYTQF